MTKAYTFQEPLGDAVENPNIERLVQMHVNTRDRTPEEDAERMVVKVEQYAEAGQIDPEKYFVQPGRIGYEVYDGDEEIGITLCRDPEDQLLFTGTNSHPEWTLWNEAGIRKVCEYVGRFFNAPSWDRVPSPAGVVFDGEDQVNLNIHGKHVHQNHRVAELTEPRWHSHEVIPGRTLADFDWPDFNANTQFYQPENREFAAYFQAAAWSINQHTWDQVYDVIRKTFGDDTLCVNYETNFDHKVHDTKYISDWYDDWYQWRAGMSRGSSPICYDPREGFRDRVGAPNDKAAYVAWINYNFSMIKPQEALPWTFVVGERSTHNPGFGVMNQQDAEITWRLAKTWNLEPGIILWSWPRTIREWNLHSAVIT
jgi:hypothetical protein